MTWNEEYQIEGAKSPEMKLRYTRTRRGLEDSKMVKIKRKS